MIAQEIRLEFFINQAQATYTHPDQEKLQEAQYYLRLLGKHYDLIMKNT